MRNKRNFQHLLGQIEAVQASFVQFIRNSQLTEGERKILEAKIEESKRLFEQTRTFLNQEDEVYATPSMTPPPQSQYGINSGRF
jgi:hypothetical protein